MPNFILRNTPSPLWGELIAKAKRDGWPLRALLLQFAQDYVDGKIAPSGVPPVDLKVVDIPKQCDHCGRTFVITVKHALGFSIMTPKIIHCPFCNHAHDLPIPGELVDVSEPDPEA